MNKIIYTLLIFILISTINFAQETESNFVWGTRLGLNYSSFGGDDAERYDVKVGATLGVFAKFKAFDNIIIQPELNYVSKGVSELIIINESLIINDEEFLMEQEYDFIRAFTYLEFPVLVKYNFGTNSESSFKPEIFAGPFGAMKINAEMTVADDATGNSIEIDDVKGFDYGFAFGAGFGVAIDNIDVLFELRYTYSLPSYDNSSEQFDLNHRVFSLSLGFVIN